MHGSATSARGGVSRENTIGEQLRLARRERFVGREAELKLVRDALSSGEPPFSVLFVHGPGGVGKTSLLERFTEIAEDAGVETARIDLGAIEATPAAVLAALTAGPGFPEPTSAAGLVAGPGRMLLLDTYELAAPIDGWVREQFIPGLAAGTVVVLAGRNPPSQQWLADPGWRTALRTISLRNLPPADTRAYLRAEAVPDELHDRALALSHGHPLALSLLSELVAQRAGSGREALPAELGGEPDVVRSLLESFVARVPGEVHRRALYVCAHARFTTEDLLRAALGVADAAGPFAWLRGLSFVEEGEQGIVPHDLARDVLEADLRWRDRPAYEQLHRRIYTYMAQRARSTEGRERQRALLDWNFLLRTNPFTASFIEWKSYGSVYYDRLRAQDRGALLEIAELHEGRASSDLVAHWLDRQPDAFRVLRAGGGCRPIGFGAVLALHKASESDIAADPGTAAMWSYAQRHGAPRAGEEVFASRFFIDRDAYQDPSGSYSTIIAAWIEKLLARRRPAWEFLGFWADPERIEPFMAYIDFHRVPAADFEVGGRRYGVFAHDWRRVGLDAWFEMAARRQIEIGFDPITPEPVPTVALSAPDFEAAVRRALRDLHRPEALAANPLLESRLVRERGGEDPAATLQALLEEAAGALRGDPRDEKLYRAMARTYLRPAPTQELAAAALDLPLSTYKRHLRRGVERVFAWLWQRELCGESAQQSS